MLRKKLKENTGAFQMDAIIAIFILLIFIAIISVVTINIYISLISMQKSTVCTDYAVKILENLELLPYSDERLEQGTYTKDYDQENAEVLGVIIEANYKVDLTITDYNKIPGNEEKEDFIKIIEVRISYKENNLEKSISIKTLKIIQ